MGRGEGRDVFKSGLGLGSWRERSAAEPEGRASTAQTCPREMGTWLGVSWAEASQLVTFDLWHRVPAGIDVRFGKGKWYCHRASPLSLRSLPAEP